MAIDYVRNIISSGYNLAKINDNFVKIETALQDGLSRSGQSPNQMNADIDLNGYDLLNVNTLNAQNLYYQGQSFGYLVQAAEDAADSAAASAAIASEGAATVAVVQGFVDELAGGTTGQLLIKNSNADYDYNWTTFTTGVLSFNGRTGLVVPVANDYSVADINGLTAQLAAKAPLDSPSFTNTPTVPTAVAGTNTTQIASTAFVTTAITNSNIQHSTAVSNPNTASVLFIGIPTGVKRIVLHCSGVTNSTSAELQGRLGSGGSVVSSGYTGAVSNSTGSVISTTTSTTGVSFTVGAAAITTFHGKIVFERLSPSLNIWEYNSGFTYNGNASTAWSFGAITLSGTPDRIQLTTVAGTALLNGNINISWEF